MSLMGPARLGARSVVVGIAPAPACEEITNVTTERNHEIPDKKNIDGPQHLNQTSSPQVTSQRRSQGVKKQMLNTLFSPARGEQSA